MSDLKPCDCIEQIDGVWVQRCDCQNSGDLAAAESWCGDKNRGAELAALRARHEKLREGIVDLMGKWHFSGNQSCAEELNALLEDE